MINKLLSLPYALKVATKDFHPKDHISFDTTLPSPSKKAFESFVTITNSTDPLDTRDIPVWPAHCVQGTKGAEIIPEIEMSNVDVVVEKGRDKNTEMFSVFSDVFGNKSEAASIDLAALLKSHAISRVDIAGLAGDYCVRCCALDARKEGFEVLVINEGIRSVDQGSKGWGAAVKEFEDAGIIAVSITDPKIMRLM